MSPKPKNTAAYLASLTPEKRSALQQLRKTIKAAAPKAVECISYGIPAFKLNGQMLVAFAAAKNHLSFFPGAHPLRAHRAALKGYEASKGTVRFAVDHPLPVALVRKLVKARVAERSA